MAQVLAATIASPRAYPDAPVEQRSDARRCLSLQVAGTLDVDVDAREFNATVRDLSRLGFLMNSATAMTVGELIYVELPRFGRVSAHVAWTEGQLAGCRFLQPISLGALSAALLRAVPEQGPSEVAKEAVLTDAAAEDELSGRQKLTVLLSLSLLSWVVVVAIGYAAINLLGA